MLGVLRPYFGFQAFSINFWNRTYARSFPSWCCRPTFYPIQAVTLPFCLFSAFVPDILSPKASISLKSLTCLQFLPSPFPYVVFHLSPHNIYNAHPLFIIQCGSVGHLTFQCRNHIQLGDAGAALQVGGRQWIESSRLCGARNLDLGVGICTNFIESLKC